MNEGVGSHGENGDTSRNELTSIVVEPSHAVRDFSVALEAIAPINERGHPVKAAPAFHSATIGTGLRYHSSNDSQGYACATGRYLNVAAGKVALDDSGRALADEMLDLWFAEHVLPHTD